MPIPTGVKVLSVEEAKQMVELGVDVRGWYYAEGGTAAFALENVHDLEFAYFDKPGWPLTTSETDFNNVVLWIETE